MARWQIEKFYCVNVELDGLETRADVERWCNDNLQFEIPDGKEVVSATIEEMTGYEIEKIASQTWSIEMLDDEGNIVDDEPEG